VCDVSWSMTSPAALGVECMDVSVALSLLLAEVAEGPYARKLITFHEQPTLVDLPATKSLAKLNRYVRSLPWGFSTNFLKVFNLLLSMNPPPKRVFVFSDMQFDEACRQVTDLQRARELYEEAGLTMPQLVFWNLLSHAGAPALAEDEDVALVSGFSSVMMRLLLEQGTPEPEAQQAGPASDVLFSDDASSTAMQSEEADEFCAEDPKGTDEKEEASTAAGEAEANDVQDEQVVPQPAGEEQCIQAAEPSFSSAGAEDGEQPRVDANLTPLAILAKALGKPLLQRPRVVHCREEALQLFRGTLQPTSEQWAVARLHEPQMEESTPPALEPASGDGNARWTTQSLHLGTLPCKEAVAAFLGRSVQTMRRTAGMQAWRACLAGRGDADTAAARARDGCGEGDSKGACRACQAACRTRAAAGAITAIN